MLEGVTRYACIVYTKDILAFTPSGILIYDLVLARPVGLDKINKIKK